MSHFSTSAGLCFSQQKISSNAMQNSQIVSVWKEINSMISVGCDSPCSNICYIMQDDKWTGPLACLFCSPFACGKGLVLQSGILLLPCVVSQIKRPSRQRIKMFFFLIWTWVSASSSKDVILRVYLYLSTKKNYMLKYSSFATLVGWWGKYYNSYLETTLRANTHCCHRMKYWRNWWHISVLSSSRVFHIKLANWRLKL